MPFSLSPSVTITERDLSSIIPQVSTTQACFVGRFDKGPVDEIVDIDSEKKLFQVFGEPAAGERGVDWFTCANFLNYSDKLKVVRVDEGDTTYYNATQGGLTAAQPQQFTSVLGTSDSAGGGRDVNNRNPHASFGFTGARIYAKEPGVLGNSLRIVVLPAGIGSLEGLLSGTTYSFPVNFGDEADLFSYRPTSSPSVFDSNQAGVLTAGSTQDEVHFAVIDQTGLLNQEQPGITGAVLESFEGLSMWKGVYDTSGRNIYYKDYINANSDFIRIEQNTHRSIFFDGRYGSGTSGGDPTWTPTTSSMPFPLGFDGNALQQVLDVGRAGITVAPLAFNAQFTNGAQAGSTAPYDGIGTDSNFTVAGNPHINSVAGGYRKHFRDADAVDIDLILGGAAEGALAKEIIEVAESRKDCVAFISPPANPAGTEYNDISYSNTLSGYSGSASIIDYRETQGFNSSYAVMDSGWKYMYDSYNDKFRWVPLNADIAGIVARTEESTGPFFSPAGMNRGRVQGVVKLALNPNKADRDKLYSVSINPVVSFPGEGAVLFGDKTLQRRASALDRINVRRLLVSLEKAIATAAKFQLFEFNDGFTRRSFISTISPFLRRIQSQRGITDFRVVCDDTNNTAEVISKNQFVADIFIKPAQSINFINLNFSVLRADATFNESLV